MKIKQSNMRNLLKPILLTYYKGEIIKKSNPDINTKKYVLLHCAKDMMDTIINLKGEIEEKLEGK